MEQTKNNYETTVIINAALEDNQVESVIAKIQEAITKYHGEISALNRWGRKRLTYSIKKKNNGYFVNMEFTAPGGIIQSLESIFLLEEHILRFLTIKLDDKALKAKALGPIQTPEIIESIPDLKTPFKEPLFEIEPLVE